MLAQFLSNQRRASLGEPCRLRAAGAFAFIDDRAAGYDEFFITHSDAAHHPCDMLSTLAVIRPCKCRK
ncbi:MAG: hypothetical protein BGP06_11670 [Rhizobiales bacterium 65-9]|nr:hypothetical protein [Hyphomicrobiales bacterium]OJY33949.1 MAG: hypothetical protein BGP06_11670 [Rhizobiales bacterium 65-9]